MKKRATGKSKRRVRVSPQSKPSGKQRSGSMGELPNEWNEFIDCLLSRRVRFLVVGAHALAVAGKPRFTRDLDIFVEPTPANAKRVCAALADFGYAPLADELTAFATPDRMATLGREPLRIDVMTSITGVSFERAWAGRKLVQSGNRRVPFLGERALKANKLASGRPKDLADLALLDEGKTQSKDRRKLRALR